MNALIQLIIALCGALPELLPLIKKIGPTIQGLDLPGLIKQIEEPNVDGVDNSIDAEIDARNWPTKPE